MSYEKPVTPNDKRMEALEDLATALQLINRAIDRDLTHRDRNSLDRAAAIHIDSAVNLLASIGYIGVDTKVKEDNDDGIPF